MMNKLRNWRVDVIHRCGYHAPSLYVATEEPRIGKAESDAIAKAKEATRLSDFPQSWTFVPVIMEEPE